MKRIIKLIICLLLSLCLFGCNNKKPKELTIELVNIEDLTISNHLSTSEALEEFYKDDEYTYYFPSIKSEYIICEFSNGDKKPFKQELDDGNVSIDDLDKYDIQYWLVDKDGKYINSLDK